MYHGIIIDIAFEDKFLNTLNIIGKKKSGKWTLMKIEITEHDIDKTIVNIQSNMKREFYSHFYNRNGDLIIIFKNKIFKITTDKSSWKAAIQYGKSVGISEKQLDFHPCRFEDEEY